MSGLFDRLKADSKDAWQAYTGHSFVQQMGNGTLPEAAFRHYLVQDYLFLIQFARAYALAIYKSRSLTEMRSGLESVKAILDVEMDLHIKLCGRWGLEPADIETAPEASETMAYTRFVLEAGLAGDLLDLQSALAPCVIGYAEIGAALKPNSSKDNPYAEWIDEYSGPDYADVANAAKASLDALAEELLTEKRYPRLLKNFRSATLLEADFWQMGLNAAGADA
ncbi:MAG: thiaminase II [Pseudomonadota bacterium]